MTRLPWLVGAMLTSTLAWAAPVTQLELMSNYTVRSSLAGALPEARLETLSLEDIFLELHS